MAWICYLLSLILWNAFDLHGWAIMAFIMGMVFHWKYWVMGLVAFFVAMGLKKSL